VLGFAREQVSCNTGTESGRQRLRHRCSTITAAYDVKEFIEGIHVTSCGVVAHSVTFGGGTMRNSHRKKPKAGLPEEVLAVLRCSPHLKPCRKFRRANASRFIAHINEGKCRQCLAFYREMERESNMMQSLREGRN
jgi:hypothetical protein